MAWEEVRDWARSWGGVEVWKMVSGDGVTQWGEWWCVIGHTLVLGRRMLQAIGKEAGHAGGAAELVVCVCSRLQTLRRVSAMRGWMCGWMAECCMWMDDWGNSGGTSVVVSVAMTWELHMDALHAGPAWQVLPHPGWWVYEILWHKITSGPEEDHYYCTPIYSVSCTRPGGCLTHCSFSCSCSLSADMQHQSRTSWHSQYKINVNLQRRKMMPSAINGLSSVISNNPKEEWNMYGECQIPNLPC